MVFIRPTILETVADVQGVTGRQYDYLRQRQVEFRDRYDDKDYIKPLPGKIRELNQPETSPEIPSER